MATLRSIQSPGVQINEIDLSQTTTAPNGTSVFIAGFAAQGPANEILTLTSGNDFQNIFGTPTNAAERYFYYSVQQQFTGGTNAQVNVYRLPYGDDMGEGYVSNKYSALVFPVLPLSAGESVSTATGAGGTLALSAASTYYFGAPSLITLTQSEYTQLKQNTVQWSALGGGSCPTIHQFSDLNSNGVGMIVLNEAQTTINEKFEGLYVNLADNTGLNPTSNFNEINNIYTIVSDTTYFDPTVGTGTHQYQVIPSSRLDFQLSATNTDPNVSLSHIVENIPSYDIANINGTSNEFNDLGILSLFKIKTSPFAANPLQLTYNLVEGYATSFYSNRTVQDVNGGAPKNDFIQTVVNNASKNLTVYVNPNISNQLTWLDNNGNAQKSVRVINTDLYSTEASLATKGWQVADKLFPLGVYAPTLDTTNNKVIGDIGAKLDNALELAANADTVNIDVVVDAGLSTIAGGTCQLSGTFDDTLFDTTVQAALTNLSKSDGTYNASANPYTIAWSNITSKFVNFTTNTRKDCIFISDPLRQVFVQGINYKILSDKSKNFSQNVYWPLRNLYSGTNSSYAATYGNWVLIQDSFTNKPTWLPFSGFASALYTTNDSVAYPWAAPAGLSRGVINGIVDIAVNPNQKQRDLLYKISVNPVVNFPGSGFSIQGQKTLLATPSAFDRINVRRLFLFLEKSVLNTSRSFVFEPNTTFTQNRLVNTIDPVFKLAKNTQGIYDYLIVCNSTNNTPSVVDDNSLVVDIYIKPVRTAEFILVNFYATKTSQNFQELLQ